MGRGILLLRGSPAIVGASFRAPFQMAQLPAETTLTNFCSLWCIQQLQPFHASEIAPFVFATTLPIRKGQASPLLVPLARRDNPAT